MQNTKGRVSKLDWTSDDLGFRLSPAIQKLFLPKKMVKSSIVARANRSMYSGAVRCQVRLRQPRLYRMLQHTL